MLNFFSGILGFKDFFFFLIILFYLIYFYGKQDRFINLLQ